MLTTLRNAWKIPELRRKLLFTLFILVIYRLGAAIYIPYINHSALEAWKETAAGSILEYLNIISGDAFSKATLFALSISPYITASIVMQLLCVAIKPLEELSKSGEEGRKKINNYTRYVTVALGLLTSIGYYFLMRNTYQVVTGDGKTVFGAIVMISCYCAGAALIMWLAEKINESGIGNGISFIILIGIIARLPHSLFQEFISRTSEKTGGLVMFLIEMLFLLLVIAGAILLVQGTRKVPVQYAKRIIGNKQYGGARQYIPLKVNAANVMPIIFAQAIMFIPISIVGFSNQGDQSSFWAAFMDNSGFWYNFVFAVLIIVFTYFYTAITINPTQMSDDLKRNNGFIPGVKPGNNTKENLDAIMDRITLPGAFFLAIVAILPAFARLAGVSMEFSQFFGGTSLLILVGVVLDTLQQVESHLLMRHYDGLLKSGRIKGRSAAGAY